MAGVSGRRRPDIDLSGLSHHCRHKMQQVVDQFLLSEDDVRRVMTVLQTEMVMGMSRDTGQRSRTSLQMENTFVRALLDGTEEGDYLALDLGGTNFRVLLCRMRSGKCESTCRYYNVPKAKLYGPAAQVFDHIADSIYKFLKEEDKLDDKLPLGFTFSFPMVQEGLKKGILVTWTKSFACTDGVGQDAVQMLEEALARRGDCHVEVVAVLNDTTGTLLAGSYLDKQCQIGLILGTGCNAAYVEQVNNVDNWTGSKEGPPEVVIDTEWGAFGDNGSLDFVKNEFDRQIDLHSNHVGSFTFEKLFAGHYIGDLARLVMLRLIQDGVLFGGQGADKLQQWGVFTAEHLSNIEKDTSTSVINTKNVLRDLDLLTLASPDDLLILRYICAVLTLRCAQLVCPALAVLMNHMDLPVMTIAIDGSLYRLHPNLHDEMTAWLSELAPNTKCKLIDAEDGSGRGAAFVAAVAVRLQQQQQQQQQQQHQQH